MPSLHLAVASAGAPASDPVGAVERELARVLVLELLGSLLPVSLAGVRSRRDLRVGVVVGSVVAAVALGAASAAVPLVVVAFAVLFELADSSLALALSFFLLLRLLVVSGELLWSAAAVSVASFLLLRLLVLVVELV